MTTTDEVKIDRATRAASTRVKTERKSHGYALLI